MPITQEKLQAMKREDAWYNDIFKYREYVLFNCWIHNNCIKVITAKKKNKSWMYKTIHTIVLNCWPYWESCFELALEEWISIYEAKNKARSYARKTIEIWENFLQRPFD